ncbi:ribonuclease BN [Haemophilus influenzae 22.4-21]|uniref:Ribonuclease BN n=1 Tax=Haemophilus influenzae 22.4-21 TaxID=375063 RepID=A4NVF0_HAEIF|nr:ribonuclease BN [Haemophilus influenzae 22.4-21]
MISLKQFSLLFWKRFSENKLNQVAGALTYSTMLAMVPLVMVIFLFSLLFLYSMK